MLHSTEMRRPELHGRDEAAAWLAARELAAIPRWHVLIAIDAGPASRFQLDVFAEEWGFAFHHQGRSSWIRITDVPFVHGRDDFRLLAEVPALNTIPGFLADLAARHGIVLPAASATVRSNIAGALDAVRAWLAGPARS